MAGFFLLRLKERCQTASDVRLDSDIDLETQYFDSASGNFEEAWTIYFEPGCISQVSYQKIEQVGVAGFNFVDHGTYWVFNLVVQTAALTSSEPSVEVGISFSNTAGQEFYRPTKIFTLGSDDTGGSDDDCISTALNQANAAVTVEVIVG